MSQRNLPLRTLPVLQQWDCHSCTDCCRAPLRVRLGREDLRKLEAQNWGDHADFAGAVLVERGGWLWRERWLAQRADGRCVFLTDENRCRIHEDFGSTAKPLACRMFPFQPIPFDTEVRVVARQSCPSAARNDGRELDLHLPELRKQMEGLLPEGVPAAPALRAGGRRDWRTARIVGAAVERLVLDQRFPMVRRLIHGLALCDGLVADQTDRRDERALRELVQQLERRAGESGSQWFGERQAPKPAAAVVFRQAAGKYVRPLAGLAQGHRLLARWRLLHIALRLATGRGSLPRIETLPEASFAELEGPLGRLDPAVLTPLDRFFETTVAGWRYCGVARFGWSIVDGFRALALAHAIAFWILRWMSFGRRPAAEDAIRLVGWLDRGHWSPPLCGPHHRRSLAALTRLGELPRLLAWYAR